MSPQAQRIAIAEACGYTLSGGHVEWWTNKDGVHDEPPNYLNDLNAMHEAEKAMSVDDRNRYIDTLGITYHDSWNFCTATAAQRAEAFLRTIGKWEEEAKS